MKPIMFLIEELNDLCELYISQNVAFERSLRIRSIFNEFVEEGYNIVPPKFERYTPEYSILLKKGKSRCEKLQDIHQQIIGAYIEGLFAKVKDLSNLQEELTRKVAYEFSMLIHNRYFALRSAGGFEDNGQIIYNDYDVRCDRYRTEFIRKLLLETNSPPLVLAWSIFSTPITQN